MLKVMTIVGTRPEIIKLSRVIDKLDKHTNHILVHTGQNFDYELNEIFFEKMRIRRPQYFLDSVGKTTMETIANILVKAEEIIKKEKPEALLVYGDTNSCLAVLAAKRNKVPVFHMEAGNRCFDQRVPEEINRRLLDHLSDINMTISEHARRYLLQEGIPGETIIKVGSSMREVLDYYHDDILCADVLKELKLKEREYFVVSAHREENIDSDKNFSRFIETLEAISEKYHKRIIVSTHPRTRRKIEDSGISSISRVEWLRPLGFFDYIKLQMKAFCVISDSGTIMEEASILGFPAITIRNAHERPEGMDEGVLILSGLKPERVLAAIRVMTDRETHDSGFGLVPDYNVENVSDKVVRIIMSYTDYIMRTVWREED